MSKSVRFVCRRFEWRRKVAADTRIFVYVLFRARESLVFRFEIPMERSRFVFTVRSSDNFTNKLWFRILSNVYKTTDASSRRHNYRFYHENRNTTGCFIGVDRGRVTKPVVSSRRNGLTIDGGGLVRFILLCNGTVGQTFNWADATVRFQNITFVLTFLIYCRS